MEYYSAIRRNEIELFVVRWTDLEPVIHSEVSQKEKNNYCILMHICGTLKNVQMNQFAAQKLRHRCREETYGHQGGKVAWGCLWWCDELGDWD